MWIVLLEYLGIDESVRMHGGEDVRFAHVDILIMGTDHLGRIRDRTALSAFSTASSWPKLFELLVRGLLRIKLANAILKFNESGQSYLLGTY